MAGRKTIYPSRCLVFAGAGLLLLLGGLTAFGALPVPTSSDNEGLNKYERINKVENDTIKMAQEFNQLETSFTQRWQTLSEQNQKLSEEVQKLQTSLTALEQKLEQRFRELQRALPPPPPPTPTRVPTANI